MKNIAVFEPSKYKSDGYLSVGNGIYKHEEAWVVSLMFEQEPDIGEGTCPQDISQYPLEDILDRFMVYISDFYATENADSKKICYLEFSGNSENTIRNLCSIVGKHVFNQQNEIDGTEVLIIV